MGEDRKATGGGCRRLRSVVGLCVVVASVSACEGLLEVDIPGNITEEEALEAALLPTLVTSGVGKYECAFSEFTRGEGEANADVWWRFQGSWNGGTEYRERQSAGDCAQSEFSVNWYLPLQQARFMTETAYNSMAALTDADIAGRQEFMATAASYAGLSYQILGEVFCEMTVNVGPLMTPSQTLDSAEVWFDRALGHIQTNGDFSFASTPSMKQLVHLGRARVRLANGDLVGAAEDADSIQPGFIAYITRGGAPDSRQNRPYLHTITNLARVADTIVAAGNYTVGNIAVAPGDRVPFTGYRNLTINAAGQTQINGLAVISDGTPDPRVLVVDNRATGGLWAQEKYTRQDQEQIYAKWAEAQFILAEYEYSQGAGMYPSVVQRINDVRATHGITEQFSSSDPDEIWWTLIEEKRREHFLEGRFWAEKLRLGLWFPLGLGSHPTNEGFPYLTGTCSLMPESEYDNNPNLLP